MADVESPRPQAHRPLVRRGPDRALRQDRRPWAAWPRRSWSRAVEALVKRDSELGRARRRATTARSTSSRSRSTSWSSACWRLRQPMARRPAHGRHGAQDLQRPRAHRRLRHQHRQARHRADQRARSAQAAHHHPADGADLPRHGQGRARRLRRARRRQGAARSGSATRRSTSTTTSLFRELLTYMMEDPRKLTGVCIDLLFVAKNLERIGDHATNIAEKIHYIVHGDQLQPSRGATRHEAADPGRRGRAAAAEAARLQSGGGRLRRRPGVRRRGGA